MYSPSPSVPIQKTVLVCKVRCRSPCNQEIEEIGVAFEKAAAIDAGIAEEILTFLFKICGYEFLELCKSERISVTLAQKKSKNALLPRIMWCPLALPGATPLLCTLDCSEYERGCYAIRNFDLR